MGVQLGTEEIALIRTNRRSTTRMAFGRKGAGLLLLFQIAFDGGEADIEHAGDLGLGSTSFNRGHDLGPQVGGICFHSAVCQIAQSLRKTL